MLNQRDIPPSRRTHIGYSSGKETHSPSHNPDSYRGIALLPLLRTYHQAIYIMLKDRVLRQLENGGWGGGGGFGCEGGNNHYDGMRSTVGRGGIGGWCSCVCVGGGGG
eukprot:Sspe_Gene.77871::Locus_48681_Transcript_1_1_Confidence_1.000_Length_498::g.77871::m.77871